MTDYILGAVTMLSITIFVQTVDSYVPGGLDHLINLYAPF